MRYICVFLFICIVGGCSFYQPAWQPDVSANRDTKAVRTHVVHKGDSLHVIAWLYDLDYRDVAAWNNIKPPYIIYPDQKLILTAPENLPAKKPVVAKKSSDLESLPKSGSVRQWQWPTRGRLVCGFRQGICQKGIYISGQFAQDVFAAYAGTVVYSGNGIKDYGGLIILQHAGGYFSAYAHNDHLLVRENERVAAGQRIALMGMTQADYPGLYFEIRLRNRLIDPLALLPLKA